MTGSVEIEVSGAGEGRNLVECLARHGFPVSLVERTGRWLVEVHSRQEPRGLVAELSSAIEGWLRASALPALELRQGGRRIPVRAAGR